MLSKLLLIQILYICTCIYLHPCVKNFYYHVSVIWHFVRYILNYFFIYKIYKYKYKCWLSIQSSSPFAIYRGLIDQLNSWPHSTHSLLNFYLHMKKKLTRDNFEKWWIRKFEQIINKMPRRTANVRFKNFSGSMAS